MKIFTKPTVAYILSSIIAIAMIIATPLLPGSVPAWAQGTLDFDEFSIPTAYAGLHYITKGPDGNLWFTEGGANKIGKITTNGVVTEYALVYDSQPYGITTGPDGNLWFTEYGKDKIGKITVNGTITEYPLPTSSNPHMPYKITTRPDGNLWFTEAGNNTIGKITTSGTVTEYAISSFGTHGITTGSDGNIWFTTDYGTIGKITTSGTVTEYSTIRNGYRDPFNITSGPEDMLWFTYFTERGIGISDIYGNNGTVGILPPGSPSADITTGPDGNIWFTENGANKIGKIIPTLDFLEYTMPTTISGPFGITTGPDGNLWFTTSNNKIVRFNLNSRTTKLTYTGERSGDYHDSVNLSAKLIDSEGKAVIDAPITFTLGNQTCTGITDSNGDASCVPSLILNQRPAGYSIIATFAGDSVYKPVKISSSFAITKEESVISYTGPSIISRRPVLSAKLTEEDGLTPIDGGFVLFSITDYSGYKVDCTSFTNDDGVATCTKYLPAILKPGKAVVRTDFTGNNFYQWANNSAQATILP